MTRIVIAGGSFSMLAVMRELVRRDALAIHEEILIEHY
jgi:hypothetical protein